jgi:excinuclease ABC subunit C
MDEPPELISLALPTSRGAHAIAEAVTRLPDRPGVYRMFDAAGEVLYVGKARSLKKRVAAYARGQGHTNRIARMIAETATMEFVTTETETEALLLEANLIKRLRPRFNVLMRDDKSFPYILITGHHEAPAIVKHRGARAGKGDYFGPFASALAVGRTINALQKAFLLRTCSDSVYESRTRPCLLYQIKRCSAPCTREISLGDYGKLAAEAKAFLSGRSEMVRDDLATKMEAAAGRLDFELAVVYRDRLAAFSAVTTSQGINPRSVGEADVFAVHQDGGQTCVQVFFFRTHQNWGNRPYFPRADKSLGPGEVLGAFISQFYDGKPVPRLVLLSHEIDDMDLLSQALSTRAEGRIEIAVPKRGEKKDLVDHALANAREALARRLAETSTQGKLLAALGQLAGLDEAPQRVEVYDNSHIMGANALGAMIVAGSDGFLKAQYRKWNIRSAEIAPGDDFAMMREVFSRRFNRLLKEEKNDDPADGGDGNGTKWPDLVIIDGGKGQLDAAHQVLADLGIADDVMLLAVSKGPDRDAGRERFHMLGRDPFQLEPRDPVLYFVQRLRDEAHRFAIGSHRAKRSKAMTVTPLDEIDGIGPARKRALLRHFGTAKAVSRASLDDLLKVPGINATSAKTVWAFFHERG